MGDSGEILRHAVRQLRKAAAATARNLNEAVMLMEAQSSRLERRVQSLLQKKSISLAKEIPFSRRRSHSGEIFFSPRKNHLGWLQRERHEVERPKSGKISSVPSSLTDL